MNITEEQFKPALQAIIADRYPELQEVNDIDADEYRCSLSNAISETLESLGYAEPEEMGEWFAPFADWADEVTGYDYDAEGER